MDRLDLEATRGDVWAPTIEYSYAGSLPPGDGSWRIQWRLYEGAASILLDIGGISFEDGPATADDIAKGFARPGDRIVRLNPRTIVPMDLPSGLNQPEAGEADRYVWDATYVIAGAVELRPIGGDIICNKGVVRP